MSPDDELQIGLPSTPFAELTDVEKKARVQEVIEEAHKVADEVGMRADYGSLVSQLELELEINPEEAATWLEAIGIIPEEDEEPLPQDFSGFEGLLAALAELSPDDEALDEEEEEALSTPPADPDTSQKPTRDLSRFDRFRR